MHRNKKVKSFDKSAPISPAMILKVFNKYPKKSFNYKQISERVGANEKNQMMLVDVILKEMSGKKLLNDNGTGKYRLAKVSVHPSKHTVTGRVSMTMSGAGYVECEEIEDDIYIAAKNTGTALHNDIVLVSISEKGRHRNSKKARPEQNLRGTGNYFHEKTEGRIVKVIKRNKTEFVGVVKISSNYAFLKTDNPKINVDFYIPLEKLGGCKNGEKAVVRLTDWPETTANPYGEIVRILGTPGNNDTEMSAILADLNLPLSFPENVLKAADQMPLEIDAGEILKRKDFRKVTTFTIDPFDAKDFDDALSLRKTEGGNWEAGVHIADVSHYIKEGAAIEKESYTRATSIYLVDRVIPMLPERLSNDLCSLKPNEDKLCFSAVFEMNDRAEIIAQWFGKTVICSDKRFTYEEAQNIIEAEKANGHSGHPLGKEIITLNKLAVQLRNERFKKGAIGFERVEVKFKLNEDGDPLSVEPKEIKDSNRLIEEFMLLANKKVAEFAGSGGSSKTGDQEQHSGSGGKGSKPFVYRVHEPPDIEKLKTFVKFIRSFGYEIKIGAPKEISFALNKLLDEVKGKPEQNIIETLAIRTMAKAEYSPVNAGHYGLAFKHYSHFTSPIRRYPDLMVHRLLDKYLAYKMPNPEFISNLGEYCDHCSEQEKKAAEAERDSVKFKQVQFMKNQIGKEFNGIISGVTDFGMFVELVENKCEGLIRIKDLDDDYYVFDQSNYCLRGKRHGYKYTLGNAVTVKLNGVDLIRKQLNLLLV